ncbi:MAG: rRNA maturation RNase YbeY [Bacteroidota bacterium]
MSINFFNEDVDMPGFSQKKTAAWIQQCIQNENKDAGICNVIFCSDAYLLEINKKYLDHHYFTDIVAFDYTEGSIISGDLFISTERVSENAKTYNVEFLRELHRVMIHGILHLCGYGDATEDEQKQMQEKEDHYLACLPAGNPNPNPK